MDQNAGFASCVNKHCPNAKVVYDLFHMVYNYARLVISAIRLRLNLSEEKRLKLKDILSFHHDLYVSCELKVLLPEVFHAKSKEKAEVLWDEWVRLAMQSNVEEITKFARNQNKYYRDGITNSGIYPIRTSVLEGI